MRSEKEFEITSQIDQIHEHSIDEFSREIYLHGEIDENLLIKFIKNLNYLNSLGDSPITIWASSEGGCTDAGFGIYDAILLSPAQINLVICGNACSMMTVITQAAKNRFITRNSNFIVHEASISMDETATNASSNVKSLKLTMEKVISIYAERCKSGVFFKNKNQDQIRQYLKKMIKKYGDWHLPTADVIKYGFADKILTDPSMVYSTIGNAGIDDIKDIGLDLNLEIL